MPRPFEAVTLKTMNLPNRFVRSATWEGLAREDGSCTPKLAEFMVQLAQGGTGLIITGHAYVHPSGQASPYQLGIHRDDLVPELRTMTDAVHREGGKIVLQVTHGGCGAQTGLTGTEAVGPSVLEMDGKTLCRAMTREEINETITAFGRAAHRAKMARFDGVQIHAAHGYLLSEFLSPFYNRRADEYGGTPENRSRIVVNAYRTVRETVGNEFPVLIKLNSEDFLDNGFTVNEMIELSRTLEKEGIDAIEMSGGTLHSDKKLTPARPGIPEAGEEEIFYEKAARRFKKEMTVPLILVGGIRSFEAADKAIQSGLADFVSMSRPLIREPGIINRWKSGDNGKSACRSDNACFRPGYKGEGIYCVHRKKEGSDR